MTAFYLVLVTRSFAGCAGPAFFSSGGPYVSSFCVFDVISKTSLSNTNLLRFSPILPFKTYLLLYFTLRLLIHIEFLFTFCFGTIVDSQEVVNRLYR